MCLPCVLLITFDGCITLFDLKLIETPHFLKLLRPCTWSNTSAIKKLDGVRSPNCFQEWDQQQRVGDQIFHVYMPANGILDRDQGGPFELSTFEKGLLQHLARHPKLRHPRFQPRSLPMMRFCFESASAKEIPCTAGAS